MSGDYGLPERMDGMRALEVGTWDGFWAFEMERRGAEVVALDLDDERDLDWPPRRRPAEWSDGPRAATGFRLAKEILGSTVERVDLRVYDATPEELGHVRPRLLRLGAASTCATSCWRSSGSPTSARGTFISAEEYDRPAACCRSRSRRYRADRDKAVVFWLPSVRTWQRMMWTAGFDRVERAREVHDEAARPGRSRSATSSTTLASASARAQPPGGRRQGARRSVGERLPQQRALGQPDEERPWPPRKAQARAAASPAVRPGPSSRRTSADQRDGGKDRRDRAHDVRDELEVGNSRRR